MACYRTAGDVPTVRAARISGSAAAEGLVECDASADADCAAVCAGAEICDDSVDNDGDNLIDCDDSDCDRVARCQVPVENCTVAGDERQQRHSRLRRRMQLRLRKRRAGRHRAVR